MIRRAADRVKYDKEMFGGPGLAHMTRILQEDEFEGHGRLCNHLLLRPGDAVGEHTHNGDFEVMYVLSGEGEYNDNGTQTTLRAGDVAVCRSGESHRLINNGPADMELLALVLYNGTQK